LARKPFAGYPNLEDFACNRISKCNELYFIRVVLVRELNRRPVSAIDNIEVQIIDQTRKIVSDHISKHIEES